MLMMASRPIFVRMGILTVLGLAGILVGFFTMERSSDAASQQLMRTPGNSSAFFLQEPSSIQELVNTADAIVVGRISGIADVQKEGQFRMTTVEEARLGEPQQRTRSHTYYGIEVEGVLLDDGYVSGQPQLRLGGEPDKTFDRWGRIRMPHAGDRYILVLHRERDNRTYGALGPWALLKVDNAQVMSSGLESNSPGFARGLNGAEFMATLNAALESRVAEGKGPLWPEIEEDNMEP
jgi:hypothetical protein